MFDELFEGARLTGLPVVTMLLFMAVFAGVVAWVFGKRRRPHYRRMARLPLEDEPGTGRGDVEEARR